MRQALDLYEQNGCGGRNGCQIPDDAWTYATSNSHKSDNEIAAENGIQTSDLGLIVGVFGAVALTILASPAAATAGVAACFLLAINPRNQQV